MLNSFFAQAFIYLAAAVLVVPLAKRMGLGSALGYLLAGVIIGPYVLGLVGQEGQDVLHFAEFGVVLMLFLVGLELEPAVLWRMRVPIIGLGGAQVCLSAMVLGLVATLFGLPWQSALAIGLILSLSSTAIVLQTLTEKCWLNTEAGKSGFSVLLFQDIAVIPMLAMMPFLALPGIAPGLVEEHATNTFAQADRPGWLQATLVLAVIVAIILAGRYLTRPIFRWIAETRSREVFIAAALLLVVGISLAMQMVGLSPALGTFLAGVVLAESEYRHELESNIEPFKGLLLGLFFLAVGASIDFNLVFSDVGLITGLVTLLIGIKLLVLLLLGKVFKLPLADNLMFSFTLAQGGEFAFLLFSFATQNHVLERDLANLLVVVVVLSMMATPLVIIVYEKLIQPLFSRQFEPDMDEEIDAGEQPVIVAGYGRFGQIVSRLLKANGIQATLLDHDAAQIEMTSQFGYKVFYGDASRAELLQAAGASTAQLLVIAIDERVKAVQMIHTARMHFPNLKLLARAFDRRHAYELMEAGADVITRETFGSALLMGEQALTLLGYSEPRAYRIMRKFKEHDEERLKYLFEVWGDDKAYGLRVRQSIEDLEKVLADDVDDQDESAVDADIVAK